MRSQLEAQEFLATAYECHEKKPDLYPGMTYLEGIIDTMNWLLNGEVTPIDEQDIAN